MGKRDLEFAGGEPGGTNGAGKKPAPVGKPEAKISPATLRSAVVAALRAGSTPDWTEGFVRIEDMNTDVVMELSVGTTIFAAIGDAMVDAGFAGDTDTVGEVASGLLGRNDPTAAKQLAHAIGCHCHDISANGAADEIERLN